MAKSLTLGPILARSAQIPTPSLQKKLWVLHLLAVVTYGSKLSPYAISRKTNELQKMTKNWPKFGPPIFFSWILPLLVARHNSSLSSYTFLKKLMNQN